MEPNSKIKELMQYHKEQIKMLEDQLKFHKDQIGRLKERMWK
jgi:hypothetical protein